MKQLNIKKLMAAYRAMEESVHALSSCKARLAESDGSIWSGRDKERLEYQTTITDKRVGEFKTAALELSIRIRDAEGRATSRTITAETVCKALEDVEDALGIPKKYLNGISVVCDPNAFDAPSSYSYTPMSTVIYAEFKGGSWRINDISRERSRRYNQAVQITLTDEAKQALVERFSTISRDILRG